MSMFFTVVFLIAGMIVLFSGSITETASAIHQIYRQLLYLTGVIMLVGSSIIISAFEAGCAERKQTNELLNKILEIIDKKENPDNEKN